MAKVCTYLKNDGHKVRVGYVSLAGLEALDNKGVNSMSEAVPGKRVWLIVYDENRPCKSYTNEDIHYYKEFVDCYRPLPRYIGLYRCIGRKEKPKYPMVFVPSRGR